MADFIDKLHYTVTRSFRQTFGFQMRPDGVLVVHAPAGASDEDVKHVLRTQIDWIRKAQRKVKEKAREQSAPANILTDEELEALSHKAAEVIPERVRYYAPKIGVSCKRITIRNQRTRWGSCSSQGNMNFNCLLMLAPPQVVDAVVVHELCHMKEMNHSPAFYREVLRVFPEYPEWEKWLKENGQAIMQRNP